MAVIHKWTFARLTTVRLVMVMGKSQRQNERLSTLEPGRKLLGVQSERGGGQEEAKAATVECQFESKSSYTRLMMK